MFEKLEKIIQVISKFYALNQHYEANAKNLKRYSAPAMTQKLKETYRDTLRVTYLSSNETPPIGEYLGSKVELHYWLICPF
ncbi:hypothetical protein [Peribacillus loiseleuriae]|uniref:Uncharacterized protein n=1 Tax=Peribacillus loiseleuriae TaxID=1679170 RepID=A0A0K9GU64_9BACI|nr:hypothetical protein [Peribacillus loiseleuriae]KMY50229.1 hypothetical protein AC625_12575 [Peribacillus loiseleuriae]